MKRINLERRAGAEHAADLLSMALQMKVTTGGKSKADEVVDSLFELSKSHPNKSFADGIQDTLNALLALQV